MVVCTQIVYIIIVTITLTKENKMATDLVTTTGEQLGCRFYGGKFRGVTLKLNLTKAEYNNYKNSKVAFEFKSDFDCLSNVVDGWVRDGKTLEFETAQSLNQRARNLEQSRWWGNVDVGFQLSQQANELRQRAKQAVQDSVSVV